MMQQFFRFVFSLILILCILSFSSCKLNDYTNSNLSSDTSSSSIQINTISDDTVNPENIENEVEGRNEVEGSKVQIENITPEKKPAYHEGLEDISPERISLQKLDFVGDVYDLISADFGYLVYSHDQDTKTKYMGFYNLAYEKVWEVKRPWTKPEVFNDEIVLFTQHLMVIKSSEGLVAYDDKGQLLWRNNNYKHDSKSEQFFPDGSGGVYILAMDYEMDYEPRACMKYHISNNGKLESKTPYSEIGNIYPTQGYTRNGANWLVASVEQANYEIFVKLSSDLTIQKTFKLKDDQSLKNVKFFPNNNEILLYGQAGQTYTTDADHKEYGFIYKLDFDCNEKEYITFSFLPHEIISLNDGRYVAAFSDRDNSLKSPIKIFDRNFEIIKEFDVNYGFVKVYKTADGFILKGETLCEGQEYRSLFINSVCPKMDTIVEEYNAQFDLVSRKTFFAVNSRTGYEFRDIFVAENGKLSLMY